MVPKSTNRVTTRYTFHNINIHSVIIGSGGGDRSPRSSGETGNSRAARIPWSRRAQRQKGNQSKREKENRKLMHTYIYVRGT